MSKPTDWKGAIDSAMLGLFFGMLLATLAFVTSLERQITILSDSIDRHEVPMLNRADTIRFVPGGLGFECKALLP